MTVPQTARASRPLKWVGAWTELWLWSAAYDLLATRSKVHLPVGESTLADFRVLPNPK